MVFLKKYGLIAVYVLILPLLARFLLDGPRYIGFHGKAYDLLLVAVSSVLAFLIFEMLLMNWRHSLRVSPSREPNSKAKEQIRRRLILFEIFAALGVVVPIIAAQFYSTESLLVYSANLLVVSFCGAFLVTAMKHGAESR